MEAGSTDRSEPLYERVERNRRKLALVLGAFVLVNVAGLTLVATLVAAVVLLAMSTSTPSIAEHYGEWVRSVALAIAVLGVVGVSAAVARGLWRSERSLLARLKATRVPQGELLPVKHALKEISLAAGFEYSPQLCIVEDGTINAFAVGRRREKTVIGVTRGFAERLERGDQRAAFANLLARVNSGDVAYATSVSLLMGPFWMLRDRELRSTDEVLFVSESAVVVEHRLANADAVVSGWFVFGFLWVFLSELLLAAHQRGTMFAAEAADATGMLLLKDPREMLRGLERVLMADNHVRAAGDAYSSLFYCWAGFGYAPEDDPEMRRLERLREVLGPMGRGEQGFVPDVRELLTPAAPRLTETPEDPSEWSAQA